eukprot:6263898-Amphidinium_carterae.2
MNKCVFQDPAREHGCYSNQGGYSPSVPYPSTLGWLQSIAVCRLENVAGSSGPRAPNNPKSPVIGESQSSSNRHSP